MRLFRCPLEKKVIVFMAVSLLAVYLCYTISATCSSAYCNVSCEAPIICSSSGKQVHVAFMFTNNKRTLSQLNLMISSMLSKTCSEIVIHIMAYTNEDFQIARNRILQVATFCLRSHFLRDIRSHPISELLGDTAMDSFFSDSFRWFRDPLFRVPLYMYKLDGGISRVIKIDTDVRFLADVAELWDEFKNFSPQAMLAMAPELSNGYYPSLLGGFRKLHQGSPIGGTLPKHMQGLNGGLVLMDLGRMRSGNWSGLLTEDNLKQLTEKYSLSPAPYWGEQDIFTYLSFDLPGLFHFLSCAWNIQLCPHTPYWFLHPFLYYQYRQCLDKPAKLLHGNCGSSIPLESI